MSHEPNQARLSDIEFEEARRRRAAMRQDQQIRALAGEIRILAAMAQRLDAELELARAETAELRRLLSLMREGVAA